MGAPNKLVEEIHSMIALTKEGKIGWTMIPNNPNYIKWDRIVNNKTFQITLQGQYIGNPNTFYFFTILKLSPQPQETIVQINTQIEPIYTESLSSLFSVALIHAKESVASVLGELIKGI